MAYTSSYSGAEIDGAVGLLNGKGLGNVTGFVKRKADGTFEEGVPSEGSVTSVGVQNDTDGGLTVTGSPITSSGTIKIKHSNVLTSASGDTAKLFPIKYDKNGHITGVGTEVTSLPASDVSAWAKASSKPTYTYSEVGAASSSHTHTTTLATSTGTSSLTLALGNKYSITAGGTSYIFTMPSKPSYTASDVGAATSDHTHDISLATDTGTSSITLAHGGKYKLSAGGSSIVFTLPSDNNTNYYHTSGSWSGLKYTATANGGAGELSFTIPTGTTSTTVAAGNHTHSQYLTSSSSLDATKLTGEIPTSSLPSYVDDVLEYDSQSSFPSTGESGKIYVATDTNLTYRWSGTAYVEISQSLALGTTSSTAYRGDYGNTAYTHSQLTSGNPHGVTKSDVGLGNVGNFKAVSTVASQGLTSTEQSNARANIGAGTSSLTIGTTSSTAAAGNHTHTTSLATSTGTSAITLAHSGKYALTAGGSSVIFTMPASPSIPTSAGSATTGISIADHSTTSIYGVGSSTTTASKVTVSGSNGSAPTLGTAFSIPNVTAAGSGSFTQGSFSGGSGSFSGTVTDGILSFSHTHTAATHGTDTHTHTAPTLGTKFSVPNITNVGSASTWSISASDVTVPVKNTSATTVVTSKGHTVTDNGHTHTLS